MNALLKKDIKYYKTLAIVLPLLIGVFIYVFSRSATIKFNTWFEFLNLTIHSYHLPSFIKYSLPDGLFAFALMHSLYFIWRWKAPLIWEMIVISFLVFSELLQGIYIAGTYDPLDLIAICSSIIISQLICIYFNYKNHNYAHQQI
jgi:hypothetical protein